MLKIVTVTTYYFNLKEHPVFLFQIQTQNKEQNKKMDKRLKEKEFHLSSKV